MQLQHLSDDGVDQALHRLVRFERENLTVILHHLREADRRRLYSKYRYSSLFDYAVKRFGYSEDQAWRRINAMRVLRDLPEIEDKIASGALSLTNLAQAQSLFRQEKKAGRVRDTNDKLAVLEKIENCSKREAEKIFAVEAPQPKFESKAIERKLIVSEELGAKLKRLEELKPNIEFHGLVELLADLGLATWDPLEKAKRRALCAETRVQPAPAQKQRVTIRHIPNEIKHALFLRDEGRCTNCGSKINIEIDHILPFALGGTNDLANLRLLCRSCNQRHAVETYGSGKMSSFLKSPIIFYGPS
jgi:hypothetical protein